MRKVYCFCLFLLLCAPCFSQKLTILAACECNEFLFIEVQFQNQLSLETISTPLSAQTEEGNHLRGAKIEYFDPRQKKWQRLQKYSHNRTVKPKVLKPSETVIDLLWGNTALLAGRPPDNIQLRVTMTYRKGNRKTTLFSISDPFTLAEFNAVEFSSEHWTVEMRRICDENHDY